MTEVEVLSGIYGGTVRHIRPRQVAERKIARYHGGSTTMFGTANSKVEALRGEATRLDE